MAADTRIQAESHWPEILHALIEEPGSTVILGETDSGKSTLARYILEGLLGEGQKVVLVDSDIGQSSLGPPGTISSKTFSAIPRGHEYNAERMFFVGSINPATAIPLVLRGVRDMLRPFPEAGAQTLVDTSGLVGGEAGRSLKAAKMKIVGPRHVIALERRGELEDVLRLCGGARVHRLHISAHARRRTTQERARYRLERFRRYFRDAAMLNVPLGAVELRDLRRPARLEATTPGPGSVVGLNNEWRTLSLGLVVANFPDAVTVKTPLPSLDGIDSLLIGSIALSPSDIWPGRSGNDNSRGLVIE